MQLSPALWARCSLSIRSYDWRAGRVPTHTQPRGWRMRRMGNTQQHSDSAWQRPRVSLTCDYLNKTVWYLNAKFSHTCKQALQSSLCRVCSVLPWAPLHKCWRPSPWQGRELWDSTLVPRLSSGRSSLGLIRSDLALWRLSLSIICM